MPQSHKFGGRRGRHEAVGRTLMQLVLGTGLLLASLLGLSLPTLAAPEDTLVVNPSQPALYLDENYYSMLEDPSGLLTIADVQSPAWSQRFVQMRGSGHPPNINRTHSTYWLRLTVRHATTETAAWYLELYDSHIGQAVFFRPQPGLTAGYDSVVTGANLPFATRPHPYKNFLFDIPPRPGQTATYYLRLHSDTRTSFRAMLHSSAGLIPELSAQYWLLGIFYGILIIMLLYNLILFFFLKEQTYLSYVLYVLSGTLLFLTEDGLGFQYLWSDWPRFNHFIGAVAPVLLLITFAVYASGFLDMASRLPALHRLGRWVVGLSTVLLVLDVAVVHSGFSFWLYLLPYGLLYYSAFCAYRNGLRPARYLLLAQALVASSLTFLIMRKLGIDFYNNAYTVYSLYAAFVAEVVILSYALGEKLKGLMDTTLLTQHRLLKQLRKKHQAQDRLVEQMRENQELKDRLNTELEALVAQRTAELRRQNETVATQNRELLEANGLLALQSAAIEKLNNDLSRDLHAEKAARIEAREVDFGEFSQIYPDKDACLRYLADLKWAQGGYRCRKCGHEKSCEAREPHARRCTRCRYVESATAGTLLQKCKFSIVKAMYAVFLLHAHKGSYSSSELARVLELRQATGWAFAQKVLAALQRRRQASDYQEGEAWTHVLLDATVEVEMVEAEAAETGE
ncbi:7TM diverse intracellular signaling domain-containing protein [Hymenobacter sp. M29]|uniref:7TM diverse intracellular signaling domain-containing protein n=1 Tax=Hymenobacter mellowenesis TaxID=3063995 RepID=A0ABT9A605_9BACT|nr:7TM diverse intracellular signaling domain-containing protein [Hymenobacter sp. M29]MDO7845263.1 7TM diverse intracellular signaling domain-containing protein [Hymenobacter sp. M29]